ncbi:hypothetical protein [Microbacterium esteraromaticum]|uniref:hypothetical protein n=1 Tax=Microbacterium esteraromaticum TaxID=57043 RepID=UPI0019D33D14|nr:hypothetical protein [Microbacterium esteraromaticum]MBN7793413.1 hypothetical protein [Microbacterium esteraromaticum]
MSETEQNGISRRTVTKAMAWAVPAVAVASTVPTAAASCIPVPVVLDSSCKKANESSYKLYFALGGEDCDDPGSCTGTITKITEQTGQGRTLYTGSTPADGVTPILICDANNMANKVWVTASIDCVDGGAPKDYLVTMPQFNSANSTCADSNFC